MKHSRIIWMNNQMQGAVSQRFATRCTNYNHRTESTLKELFRADSKSYHGSSYLHIHMTSGSNPFRVTQEVWAPTKRVTHDQSFKTLRGAVNCLVRWSEKWNYNANNADKVMAEILEDTPSASKKKRKKNPTKSKKSRAASSPYFAILMSGWDYGCEPKQYYTSLASAKRDAKALRSRGVVTNVRIAGCKTRQEAIDADISTARNIV